MARSSASSSASSASASATSASSSASTASSASTSATNAKTAAQAAQTAAESAQTAAETAAETAEDYAASIDPDTLAKIDGYYQEMTVGDAEQIVSSILVEDKAPYKFRTAGGSVDIGKRAYFDAIVGGTVAWNQLIINGDFSDGTYNWGGNGTTTTVSGNVMTAVANGTNVEAYKEQMFPTKAGHKYLCMADIKTDGTTWGLRVYYNGTANYVAKWVSSTSWQTTAVIISNTAEATSNRLRVYETVVGVGDTVNIKNLQVFDLTAMLGSTIADYIYSLEQATEGAGVAFFRKYFPNSYYSYNAGELVSVSGLSAHKTTGFNQWDEEWEVGKYSVSTGAKDDSQVNIRSKNYIPVLPNTTYYGYKPSNQYGFVKLYYDANKNLIGYHTGWNAETFTTPSNACYMTFYLGSEYGTTYNHDICINLSWDGSRDGEYEEYKEHTYPLDDNLTLRGIPKLDASNKLYFDGDTYESDGTVDIRYGVYVCTGNENWQEYTAWSSDHTYYFNNFPSNTESAVIDDIFTVGYSTDTMNNILSGNTTGILLRGDNHCFYVSDPSITSADDAKAKFPQGKEIIYKKTPSTTETAEPYSGIQIVDDFGTEEFITDTVVPVGHVTHYPVNLVAKLEMMPNSPDGSGDYIVQQDSGINTYIPLASTDTITNIIARLEALEGGGE